MNTLIIYVRDMTGEYSTFLYEGCLPLDLVVAWLNNYSLYVSWRLF